MTEFTEVVDGKMAIMDGEVSVTVDGRHRKGGVVCF